MKKLFKSVLFAAVLGSGATSLGLPVGNPGEPSLLIDGVLWEGASGDPCDPCSTWCDALSLRAGFFGDYVFNRLLKTDVPAQFQGMAAMVSGGTVSNATTPVSRANIATHKNMTQSELYTNAGYLALNIWDRFDVFCTLGTTNAYIKGSSAAFNLIGLIGKAADPGNALDASKTRPNANIANAFVELYTDAEFSWSIGARGALWECGCATLGAEFQYAQAKPEISQINVVSNVAQFSIAHPKGFIGEDAKLPLPYLTTEKSPDMSKTKSLSANYNEWQIGLALAYRLNFISPYVGIKWSRAKIDFDGAYIAQPQLTEAEEKLDMQTWNPTLFGTKATGAADEDVLTQVSVTLNKLKSRKSTGFVTGATLIDADKFAVTVEGRFIDEKAVHVNGQFRF
ncbi:porin [Chlamydiifrater volucris]|uniref:porin n=1 Tax=Chlamydiifrater volucris TaxID=2681470 RepID=UPI001BCE354E|nr:porin [Chlamydiifrater volucris]